MRSRDRMNNIRFSEFVEVMDSIGCEYSALSRTKKIGLMYSGGVDSTAILLSLMNANAKITLVHILFFNPPTSYSIFCEGMTKHLANKYGLATVFVPNPPLGEAKETYQAIADTGYQDLISGEGMDRIYLEYFYPDGSSRHWTYGEPFRAQHPWIDRITSYVPNRLAVYGLPNTHHADDHDHIRDKKDAAHSGTNLYFYSSHPLMIELFKRYKEDVGDIFFRKRLTEFYVKEKLGVNYNSLVKEVCRENKDRMEPTMKRFFMYVENKKKKPDDGLENASC
jgi:hypothetical protein